jgi:dTDP-glucose 4,6-dehydratase
MKTRYLVTGGAGFIGSNFIRQLLAHDRHAWVTNLDKLTYAGNLDNVADLESNPHYRFVRGDIAQAKTIEKCFRRGVDVVVHFAAETHVDRSIVNAGDFIDTDIKGTFHLLEQARRFGVKKFIQVSTDEVYGSIARGSCREDAPLMPRNPYSASKAGADRLAYSFFATHRLPVIITRCSNNYGPYQHPEKMLPLFISNALEDKPLPLYGDGRNVRDWIHVQDHCAAILFLLRKGKAGEVYNISGDSPRENIEITRQVLKILGKPANLIRRVQDRPGHDRRYSIDGGKLKALGFRPKIRFEDGLKRTVRWYQDNASWWHKIKAGSFRHYYKKQYGRRLATASL